MQDAAEAADAGDYRRVAQFLVPLAAKGDMRAQYNLGASYQSGLGVKTDLPVAAAWYRKAANQGYPSAEINLGEMYRTGQGVAKDPAEARLWLGKAAALNIVKAQHDLGLAYLGTDGGSTDYAKAMAWFRKAADQGFAPAQVSLADMYAKGERGPIDTVSALIWYDRAARWHPDRPGDLKAAAKARAILLARMTPVDIAAARRQGQGWSAKLDPINRPWCPVGC